MTSLASALFTPSAVGFVWINTCSSLVLFNVTERKENMFCYWPTVLPGNHYSLYGSRPCKSRAAVYWL